MITYVIDRVKRQQGRASSGCGVRFSFPVLTKLLKHVFSGSKMLGITNNPALAQLLIAMPGLKVRWKVNMHLASAVTRHLLACAAFVCAPTSANPAQVNDKLLNALLLANQVPGMSAAIGGHGTHRPSRLPNPAGRTVSLAKAPSLRRETLDADRRHWSLLYEVRGKELPRGNITYNWAGGGLLGTAADLARVGAATLDPTYLAPRTLKLYTTPVRRVDGSKVNADGATIGIGWCLNSDQHGRRFFHHSGVTRGARSPSRFWTARVNGSARHAATGTRESTRTRRLMVRCASSPSVNTATQCWWRVVHLEHGSPKATVQLVSIYMAKAIACRW